ncbi:hypothetical protein VPHK567_0101 [Vibrio phage K567]
MLRQPFLRIIAISKRNDCLIRHQSVLYYEST